MPRRAFTLIEAVIAITVLALVAGACLQLRADSLSRTRTLSGRHELDRAVRTIFDLAVKDRLGPSRKLIADDPNSPEQWEGTFASREYTLVKELAVVPNPLTVEAPRDGAAESPYPALVALWRYTLTLDGQTRTLEWTR